MLAGSIEQCVDGFWEGGSKREKTSWFEKNVWGCRIVQTHHENWLSRVLKCTEHIGYIHHRKRVSSNKKTPPRYLVFILWTLLFWFGEMVNKTAIWECHGPKTHCRPAKQSCLLIQSSSVQICRSICSNLTDNKFTGTQPINLLHEFSFLRVKLSLQTPT